MKTIYEEILCAGFGGQGIMFMGKLLAEAGLLAGQNVTWMPAYGAEVRGGTSYSMVKISNAEIASPIVINPGILVVMNKPSLLKYESKVKPGGILISNKSLIGDFNKPKGIKVVNMQMTEIASKLGDIRCANMIAIGAIAKHSTTISIRNVMTALKSAFQGKEDLFILNKKAIEKGYGA
ncbi:MAG: 2-oxoacid:acceptor oxidoreductase family protein [Candidatus Omnitrophota bacterium]